MIKFDLVKAIASGNRNVGFFWTYSKRHISEIDLASPEYDDTSGAQYYDYVVTVDVDAKYINWDTTMELFVGLDDFEKEIRLLPDSPLNLVAIHMEPSNNGRHTPKFKKMNTTSIQNVLLTNGHNTEKQY